MNPSEIVFIVKADIETRRAAYAVRVFCEFVKTIGFPVHQNEFPEVWSNLLKFVNKEEVVEILTKCGLKVTGEGTKNIPFSASWM